MTKIFPDHITTRYVEGDADRPAVVAAWHKRMGDMSPANVDFPSSVTCPPKVGPIFKLGSGFNFY